MKTISISHLMTITEYDESFFFYRVKRLAFILRFEGRGDWLHIYIDETKITDYNLTQLFVIFYRYNIDLKSLEPLLSFTKGSNRNFIKVRFEDFLERNSHKLSPCKLDSEKDL